MPGDARYRRTLSHVMRGRPPDAAKKCLIFEKLCARIASGERGAKGARETGAATGLRRLANPGRIPG